MRCVKVNDKKTIKDFIRLSHRLYKSNNNTQNDQELRQLLLGEHILSPYFSLKAFCIYIGKEIVGRFAITFYQGDDTAYLGFYESDKPKDIGAFIFSSAENYVRQKGGYTKILGPVDASFWIKYRLKINGFEASPYTGEPYNLAYYQKHFEDNGYKVIQAYTSSAYSKIAVDYMNEKSERRYKEFIKKGYQFVQPTNESWNKNVNEIYTLISDLYSNFPVYKPLSRSDFQNYFNGYKQIINYEMVRIVYYEGKAVGFYISMPNYNNLVYHTKNPLNIFKIVQLKKKPSSYVMLYMGADKEHLGLGSAIIKTVLDTLKENQLPSIGALMRHGKVTRGYAKDRVVKQFEYVLYEKQIETRQM